MKKIAFLLAFTLIAGCSSGSSRKSDPEPRRDTARKTVDRNEAEIANRKRELNEVERNLSSLTKEKEEWSAKPPSENKVNRLAEIDRQESTLTARRDQLNSEIATLEGGGSTDPNDTGDAFDRLDKATKSQEDKLAEKIRRQAEEEERTKMEEASRKKKEELERMKRDKEEIAGKSMGGSDTKALFEEKYADIILNVLRELERYKRR